MMDEPKQCPMTWDGSNKQFEFCIEDECAWYDRQKRCCALLTTADKGSSAPVVAAINDLRRELRLMWGDAPIAKIHVSPNTEPRPNVTPSNLTVSVKQAATLLGVSLSNMYDLIADGRVKHIRLRGRILIPHTFIDDLLSTPTERRQAAQTAVDNTGEGASPPALPRR